MKMLEAMRDTVALMERGLAQISEHSDMPAYERIAQLDNDLKPSHLRDMLRTMESGINPQNPDAGFSEGKMGRWLGWAQAAVVAMQCATLDDMKAINKRWAA